MSPDGQRGDGMIDCHVHVFDPARHPYAPDTYYAPAGQELGTPARLAGVLDWHGVDHAVLVGPNSGYGEDNRLLLDRLAAGDPGGARSVGSGCAGMVRWAGDARAYFTVPDPDQEAAWERTQSIAVSAGTDCRAALDAGDDGALVSVLNDRMLEAARVGYPVLAWIQAQLSPDPS